MKTNRGATDLRSYLSENGIVHRWFAKRIGCSPSHLSKILAGEDVPGPSLRQAIFLETGRAILPASFELVEEVADVA